MSEREYRRRRIEELNNAKKYGGTGKPVEIVDPNTGKSVIAKPGSAAYAEFFKSKGDTISNPATVSKALDILKEDKKKAEIKLEKAIEKSEQKKIQQSDDPVEKPVQKGTSEFNEIKEKAVTQAKTNLANTKKEKANFEVPGSGSLAPGTEFEYLGTRLDNTNIEKQEGRTFGEVQSEIGQLNKNEQLLASDVTSLAGNEIRQSKKYGRGSDEHKAAVEARKAKELELKQNREAKEVLLEERTEIAIRDDKSKRNAELVNKPKPPEPIVVSDAIPDPDTTPDTTTAADTTTPAPGESQQEIIRAGDAEFAVPGSGSLAPDTEFDYVGTRLDNTTPKEQQEGRTFAEVQSEIGQLDKNDELLESDEASLANHARRQATIYGRGSDEHKAALEAKNAKTLERKQNKEAKEKLLQERKDIVVQQAEDNVEEAAKEVAEIDEQIEEAEAKENNTETVETPDLPPEDEPPVVVTDEPLPDIQEQEEDDGEEEETPPEETAPEETAPEEEPEPPTTTEELIEESPEPETPDTKKKKKTHVPPIIIQHPEDGKFQIGRERPEDDNSQQKIQRLSDVLLEAGSAEAEAEGGSVKLFHDGGFELKSGSGDSGIQGCQIMQMCEDAPLIIHSKGNIIIDCEGTFAVTANDIQMRAKNRRGLEKGWNQSGSINLKASKNIKIDADKAITVTSETVVIDAKRELLCHSEGFNFLIGRVVRIHEPRSKLIPPTLKEVMDKHLKPFRG